MNCHQGRYYRLQFFYWSYPYAGLSVSQRPRLRMGGAGAAIGASSVMTMDAGATANSGRAVAAIPEPLNTAGAGGVIPREIFFPRKRLVYLVQKGFLGSTA